MPVGLAWDSHIAKETIRVRQDNNRPIQKGKIKCTSTHNEQCAHQLTTKLCQGLQQSDWRFLPQHFNNWSSLLHMLASKLDDHLRMDHHRAPVHLCMLCKHDTQLVSWQVLNTTVFHTGSMKQNRDSNNNKVILALQASFACQSMPTLHQ